MSGKVKAQQIIISGKVTNENGQPLSGVNISAENDVGTSTNHQGAYELALPSKTSIILTFSHINFITHRDTVSASGDMVILDVMLKERATMLEEVSIREGRINEQISIVNLKRENLRTFPMPSPDISRILATLPGVVNNNELSNSYSVRGGNFDENLIYVEGIPVYKPQISSSGSQEGLGFVNLQMVKEVGFSSGGWAAHQGDRLSSVLTANYLEPQQFTAAIEAGFLGGSVSVGSKIGNTSFLAGLRHKNTRYLLNSLETEGEYFPRFTDFQFYTNTILNSTTSLTFLGSFARNRYEVLPTSRITEFGTFNQAYRLNIGFEGKDILSYDTYQGGVKFQKIWNAGYRSSFILSAVKTLESEYTELEGVYRLCDVNKNVGSEDFNECEVIRGTGSLFDHRRNYLKGEMIHAEWQNEIVLSNDSKVIAGVSWDHEVFNDRLSEYNFTDSADYVTELTSVNENHELKRNRATGYVELSKRKDNHSINAGVRLIYRTLNDEFVIDPRVRYSFRPKGTNEVIWKIATGIYRQAPVYREFRNRIGEINRDLKMQASWHLITGMDKSLELWGRPFKLVTEAYYKYLWNVNPYEINNVRIRYFADNKGKGYATGADFRLSGEFIRNTESWFSLGLLSTKEDIPDDGRGFIRRPMDQRVTMAIYFQDHLPENPSFRVNVHVQVGTGLPFGPPNSVKLRNTFNGATYRRVDIGFSKVWDQWEGIQDFTISAEILNLTGSRNVISYTWIEDVYNQQFAVPNGLSARFLNLRAALRI